MINKELIEYIDSQRKLGKDDETIRHSLLGNNWTNEDIDQALKLKNNSIVKKVKVTYISGVFLFISFILFILGLINSISYNNDILLICSVILFGFSFFIFIISLFRQTIYSIKLAKSQNALDKKQGKKVLSYTLFILIIVTVWLFLN